MITSLLQRLHTNTDDINESKLFDEVTFYPKFLKDLHNAGAEIIIESPFITCKRLNCLLPALKAAKSRRVKLAVNMRDPEEHNDLMRKDAYKAISQLQHLGIQVIFIKDLHRKSAILDRKILYEGSLNIMSQSISLEVMRRYDSVKMCWQMIGFTGLDKLLI